MEYVRCSSCNCFKNIEEIGCRKSGIVYKCCKSCRSKKVKTFKNPIKADEFEEIEEIEEIELNTNKRSKDLKKCPDCDKIWKTDDGIWEIGTPWDSDIYEKCPKCKCKKLPVFEPDSESD